LPWPKNRCIKLNFHVFTVTQCARVEMFQCFRETSGKRIMWQRENKNTTALRVGQWDSMTPGSNIRENKILSKVWKSVYSDLGTQLALLTQQPKEFVYYGKFLLNFLHWKVSDHCFTKLIFSFVWRLARINKLCILYV
jgi:hypothetical protein